MPGSAPIKPRPEHELRAAEAKLGISPSFSPDAQHLMTSPGCYPKAALEEMHRQLKKQDDEILKQRQKTNAAKRKADEKERKVREKADEKEKAAKQKEEEKEKKEHNRRRNKRMDEEEDRRGKFDKRGVRERIKDLLLPEND